MDVKTDFLNGEFGEEIYMEQSDGCTQRSRKKGV
jgi:hypothetical protein